MHNSFDLFDTLIARRCVSPTLMWADVERASLIPGLAQARMVQGHRLWSEGVVHETADMYGAALLALGRSPGLATTALAAQLASLEFASEQRELLPVRRHLLELKGFEWIISDMHHPDWVLHRLLARAKEAVADRRPHTLVRTNRGKHDGVLWQQLRRDRGVLHHVGDNRHADVAQARAAGHQAQHTEWTLPNPCEVALNGVGATSIMRAARAARLRCVGAAGEVMSQFEEAFASHVFPALALGAVLLRDAMAQLGRSQLLFCGRDGATWLRVFAVLYPDVPAWVLPSSRSSLIHGSSAYARLVQSNFLKSPDVLLADLCGTGGSWAVFCERWRVPPRALVFLNGYAGAPERLDGREWSQGLVNVALDRGGLVFEALCEETYPSLVDAHSPPAHSPLTASSSLAVDLAWGAHVDARTQALPARMHQVLDCALEELRLELARANDRIDGIAAKDLVRRLIEGLAPLNATVERLTGFGQRNLVPAQSYEFQPPTAMPT